MRSSSSKHGHGASENNRSISGHMYTLHQRLYHALNLGTRCSTPFNFLFCLLLSFFRIPILSFLLQMGQCVLFCVCFLLSKLQEFWHVKETINNWTKLHCLNCKKKKNCGNYVVNLYGYFFFIPWISLICCKIGWLAQMGICYFQSCSL